MEAVTGYLRDLFGEPARPCRRPHPDAGERRQIAALTGQLGAD
jgi:hypothetical protein